MAIGGKTEIRELLERNRRVELDKEWETSVERRVAVSAITYAVVLIFLLMISAQRPFLTSLVPVAGFLLSTLTLGKLKSCWLSRKRV